MATQTCTADGNFLLNATPGESSADGLALTFTITGTNSGVLAVNTAPPGAAVSLANVAYLNGALAPQSAGTAITASGLAYVSAETASRGDLYLVLNWTSGTVVVNVAPSSLGNSGASPGGTIPAADVTAGMFGANTGDVGDYSVPDDFTVGDVLTTSGATTSLSQSATTAQVNVGSGTGSGNSVTVVRGAAGTERILAFNTGTSSARWRLSANSTAEAGANAGSNLLLSAYDDTGVAIDDVLTVRRVAAGAIAWAAGRSVGVGGLPGAATTATKITKRVTAIADNVATTVLTVTVPNVAGGGVLRITAAGFLGAGGAIGAYEAGASNSYDISFGRTVGVAAVADIATATGVNAWAVAGAATCTAALTVAAVVGAVGASNSFPIQVTIVKSGGASDNHTCELVAEILNATTGGITIA